MPDKRFQVFVSSTFRDLEEERQEVMHALLELDCMPSGMELFPAANDTQWNLIKKVIDDCDYYVLLIAGRYGSEGPDGLSYTEMEYRYAVDAGKPVIAFLHRNPGKISAEHSEQTDEGKRKLAAFRALVEKRLCKHWDSPVELGSVVSRSLIRLVKDSPAVGWVRANELPDRDATEELLRLRRQVDELQAELARSRVSAPKGAEELAQGSEVFEFGYTLRAARFGTFTPTEFAGRVSATWNDLFSVVAPLMIHESSEASLKTAINALAEERARPKFEKRKDADGYEVQTCSVEQQDFQTIKIQLRALGLIAKNDKARSVKDSGTYWTLTPYGDEVMTRLRAIRRLDSLHG